jgi:hypothetical protein
LCCADFNINPNNAPRTSQKEALSSDASGALFSIYLKTADEEDTKMTDSWKGDAEGILVFVCRRKVSLFLAFS